MDKNDLQFMQEAIDWAGECVPIKERIPKVGAIIAVDGKAIGRGRRGTGRDGDDHHAEKRAFDSVEQKDRASLPRATLYTTLEPCTKIVRTLELESCSELICQQQIKTVFVGMLDPNQAVTGKGLWRLQEAGKEVVLFPHELSKKVLGQNAEFIRSQAGLGAEILSPKNGEELLTYETQGKHPIRFKCLNPPSANTYLFTCINGIYWPQRGSFRPVEHGVWEIDVHFGATGEHVLQIVTANDLGSTLVGYYGEVVDQNLRRREKLRGKMDVSLLGGDYPGIRMKGLPKGLRLEASVTVIVARKPELITSIAKPTTIARGKTLDISYEIESDREIPKGMWLGASFRDSSNKLFCVPTEDKPVAIAKGRNIYHRTFTVDIKAPIGEQKLGTNLWVGVPGDSNKSTMVASKSVITITITDESTS
jgi:pyrimidine deaminase RibD-like protein